MAIMGRSQSTLENYANHLAKAAVYLNCVPTEADHEQVEQYLFYLHQSALNASSSFFKFAIFSLRYAYKIEGMPERYHKLPSIKTNKKLPVVLSRGEVKRLIAVTSNIQHKVLIGLLYGCGLRASEVRHLMLTDIDFDRKMLHVRQGKGKKDRYVPLSVVLLGWIREYTDIYEPSDLLLYGGQNPHNLFYKKYSPKGFSWIIGQAAQKAKISKHTTSHTLRHTFATHLLEEGLDIVSIKELLGHSRIETTLVYLHVAHYDRYKPFSPLDTLYQKNKPPIKKPDQLCQLLQHINDCNSCKNSGLGEIVHQQEMVLY